MSKSFKENMKQHEMTELKMLVMKSTLNKVSNKDIEC